MRALVAVMLISLVILAWACRDEDFIRELQDDKESVLQESPEDYVWDSTTVVLISLEGNSISVDPDTAGVTVNGNIATIATPVTCRISGSLSEGQLVVNTESEEIVRLILDGADIRNASGPALNIQQAEKVLIYLEDGTENYVEDGLESDAAVFSTADLTISGRGKLTVEGNYNDGIASKDGILITEGTLVVRAADDGIRGKDYLIIRDGNISIDAGGDGLKSDNTEGSLGYVTVEFGTLDITSGGDAIQAETDATISGGEITLTAGGGSSSGSIHMSASAKGIKAGRTLTIEGGNLSVNSADDAVHSNGNMTINGGTYELSTGDDGFHADNNLVFNGGEIRLYGSYEGLESADSNITVNGGNIYVQASDDGINVAGGGDAMGGGGGFGRPTGGGTTASNACFLYLNGGHIVVDADGDGIDVNGSVEMTDGDLIIIGPTSNGNGAVDYNGSFRISGGFLLAAGSSGMAQAPGETSTQNSLKITFRSTLSAGTLVHIQTGGGQSIVSFAPAKRYASVVFSSPALKTGSAYEVYYGGSDSGTIQDYIYEDGTYSPGTRLASLTISRTVTNLNY